MSRINAADKRFEIMRIKIRPNASWTTCRPYYCLMPVYGKYNCLEKLSFYGVYIFFQGERFVSRALARVK
jgi:hypothetical protein